VYALIQQLFSNPALIQEQGKDHAVITPVQLLQKLDSHDFGPCPKVAGQDMHDPQRFARSAL
jgi:hypothetical protein